MVSKMTSHSFLAISGALTLALVAGRSSVANAAPLCSDFSGVWEGSCSSLLYGDTWDEQITIDQKDCQNLHIFDLDYVFGIEIEDAFVDPVSGDEIGWVKELFDWDSNQQTMTFFDKGEITGEFPEKWDDYSQFSLNALGQLEIIDHFREEWTETTTTPPTIWPYVDEVHCAYTKS